MKSILVAAVLGLASVAQAHMEMVWPPPFRSRYNRFTTDIDYSMTNPLSQTGSDFPCKGYHSLLGTGQGQSVVTWQPGQSYNWTLTGSATHNGGSCQVSLSYDRGSTWTVLHSYIGQCPLSPTWRFTLPNDTPAGSALFAFSWNNNLGNRELYMNCAHVTIAPRLAARDEELQLLPPTDPFSSRPRTFFANIGNGCSTVETYDVLYPNPGPDVDNRSSRTSPPSGTCRSRKRVAQEFQG
ncbi:hypothetical protein S40285_04633 [Stachybotrys chlorohalonatus IBT 40285]|uniref:Extracellular protein n=1 Tax=Stachybotrys chlorohalonatus (strain IBT 40285) TaxID=1283841 RepID=A0A084QZS9_STAC4|nr:hypothetical protein S40285_04633 [Stachybotrys chlorohalonata IBT 40285]